MAGINGWHGQSSGGTAGNSRACEQCKTCRHYQFDEEMHMCNSKGDSIGAALAYGRSLGNCREYLKGKPQIGKPDFSTSKVKLGPCSICHCSSNICSRFCSCLRCLGFTDCFGFKIG